MGLEADGDFNAMYLVNYLPSDSDERTGSCSISQSSYEFP